MKKLLLIAVFVAFFVTATFAIVQAKTSKAEPFVKEINTMSTEKKVRTPQVLEGKVPLWKAKKFDINAKVGYDIANGKDYYMIQAEAKLEKGACQYVGDFAKGLLFKKN